MPPETVVAFSQPVWDEIVAALDRKDESAGVMLAGMTEDETRLTYTVNRIIWVPDAYYVERTHDRMSIVSAGWVPVLKVAADEGLQPIFFHTHPAAEPTPSERDECVNEALAEPFHVRVRTDRYASFILGGEVGRPMFTGRVVAQDGTANSVTRVRVVGRSLRLLPAFDNSEAAAADQQIHDRQIRAFGSAGQRTLAQLRVGVVGAGGTGSAVIEQLTRLGVRDIVSIDDDIVTATNVSRVYGSSVSDEDRAKVDVAEDNAARIGLGTNLSPYKGRIDKRANLELLRHCDVVFGCTDDHTGRWYLSALSFYYLLPIIDMAVAIDAPDERVRSISGRITYVGPGEPCLICRGVVDPDRVRDEGYEPEVRERLAGEGYAQSLGEPDPSVVAYTTMVASWGVADLLERLFGFGAEEIPGEILLRIADRKMKGRRAELQPGHVCGDRNRWGLGDQPDFLGQKVWLP